VALFIARLPLFSWFDQTRVQAIRRWSVSLPALPTVPGSKALVGVERPQRWVLDTGFTGDAYAWRTHLVEAGLDPRAHLAGTLPARSVFGERQDLPVCKAGLWLISNLPALRDAPFYLELSPGILFREGTPPDPEFNRPLLGLRALLRAGLKVQIDFARATVSLWTPGPWYRGLSLGLRRLLTGYAKLPVRW
jgi:hypothetical protein